MAFSLAGFGAGLAESMSERIEEERKFSNLALQGRIERASELKLQQDKQAKEIEDELRSRKAELVQLGVDDPELQKAYLFSPTVFEAFKKAKSDPEMSLKIDPKTFIAANKQLLSTMTGTVDDAINNAVRAKQQVEPAKLLEPQGRSSFFAPSAGSQSKRFEQLASARGLTMEDVARAESGVGPKMPEPAGAINFDAYPKAEKKPLGGAAEEEAATGRYLRLLREKGEDDPATKAAEAEAKQLASARKKVAPELTDQEFDHAKNMSMANSILSQRQKYSPEQIQWAESYRKEYKTVQKKYEDSGEKNPFEPNKVGTFQTTLRRAAQDAVSYTFGKKPGWTLVDVVEGDKIVGQKPKYNGQIPQDVFNENVTYVEKQGMLAMGMQAGWIEKDGTVRNPALRGAMANMFEFDGDKLKPLSKPTRSLDVEAKPTTRTLSPRTGAASAASAPAVSDAFAEIGRKPASAAAPAAAARKPAEPKTTAEFEALPPGTPYINPKDKQVYIKN